MINILTEKIKKMNAPIVVGLDPTLALIPDYITKKHIRFFIKKSLTFFLWGNIIFEILFYKYVTEDIWGTIYF